MATSGLQPLGHPTHWNTLPPSPCPEKSLCRPNSAYRLLPQVQLAQQRCFCWPIASSAAAGVPYRLIATALGHRNACVSAQWALWIAPLVIIPISTFIGIRTGRQADIYTVQLQPFPMSQDSPSVAANTTVGASSRRCEPVGLPALPNSVAPACQ